MNKITFFLCLLAGITITKLIAQNNPPEEENIEDSTKIYIKQSANAINGEITYKSPVFFAFSEKQEKLVIQLNTTSSRDHIEITFLAADVRCSNQGEGIEILMDDGHTPLLVNYLPSNCRNMQAAIILNPKIPSRRFSTPQSETMFFGFFRIMSFTLIGEKTMIRYRLDEQSAEKFRIAYKCFEKFVGIWE